GLGDPQEFQVCLRSEVTEQCVWPLVAQNRGGYMPKNRSKLNKSDSAESTDPLSRTQDYSDLSLLDLLAARDLYHLHLAERKGVIGTAVGRYLIRKEDSWPNDKVKRKGTGPRTLDNSEVRPYSWPCVLAFVERWIP